MSNCLHVFVNWDPTFNGVSMLVFNSHTVFQLKKMKLTPSKRTNKTPTKSDRVDHPKLSIECDFSVYRNSANSLIYLNNADFTALALQAGSLISLSKTINNPTIKVCKKYFINNTCPSVMLFL